MEEKTLGQVAYEGYWQQYPDTWKSQADYQKNFYERMADAVIAAYEARRWQTIESAPKDRPVILTGPLQDGGEYQDVCKWYKSNVVGKDGCWPVVFMSGFGAPTHWAECLPAPPKEGE